MTFLGRGLLVATAAVLLTALGFAQSNAAEGGQYGTDIFHTTERDQYGTDIFHSADRDQQGTNVFQTAGREQYGNNVFHTADPQFMSAATQDAMSKIHLAYLALQNAQNEQVKSFALQILTD
jgi:predicted outer membrane protein